MLDIKGRLIQESSKFYNDLIKPPYNLFQSLFIIIFGVGSAFLYLSEFRLFFIVLFLITLLGKVFPKFLSKFRENWAEITIFSIITSIVETNPLEKISVVPVMPLTLPVAIVSIIYSEVVNRITENYEKEQRIKKETENIECIKSKYNSKLNNKPYLNKINAALNTDNNWQAACLSIYIQRRIENIKLFIRAPDDMPKEKFDPFNGEPNLFTYIPVDQNDGDKKYVQKIIRGYIEKYPLKKLSEGGEFKSKDREELAEIFTKIADKIKVEDSHFASYCYQLAKMVYWKKFYNLYIITGEEIKPPNQGKLESIKIFENEKTKIEYISEIPIERIVPIKDRNALCEDIIKCSEYRIHNSYYHTIELYEYPNLHLLDKLLKDYSFAPPDVKNPREFLLAPQFDKEFKAEYRDLWITEEINTSDLEYMMTLGGAYLLEKDWFPFQSYDDNSESPKFYIQHPFQEKVVIEVLNHQNYAYPSEMIRNWKKWMKSSISKKEERFVWVRESSQPVVNKIKITKKVIEALRKKYSDKEIEITSDFNKKLDNLKEDLKKNGNVGYFLFFQIYDQFVRTPTTAIGIITIENDEEKSKLYSLTEEFKKRQDYLKEIFKALDNGKVLSEKDFTPLWREKNNETHSFLDPISWINLGVLGIIAREVKCCYALLKIIDHYLNSEEYKNELKPEERKQLKQSKEEIYDYLEKEYLSWLFNVLTTIAEGEIFEIFDNPDVVYDKRGEILKYLGKLKDLHEKNDDKCILKHKIWGEIENHGNKPRC